MQSDVSVTFTENEWHGLLASHHYPEVIFLRMYNLWAPRRRFDCFIQRRLFKVA